MSYYDLCCRYRGKVVTISCLDGKRYTGTITHVTDTHVYLQPTGTSQFGGFGYGWGWGWGRPGFGLGFPIALAAIGGLALGSALWWI
ncbi:hypothetical protein [Halalkalibacter akibai]|uniref:Uncharacterized protein n=1 Tax=Halalkalibacter akibai (strain ATCC 43226 / DSM 21942 / CIP 109018 / JCM 9157 / 1139) TaxID=1236973 RepID=W4QQA9_HALA3|nr:hypothetical protein [Halalkalibacter akibai]GAE34295.1 hypothetical protein JCM9157_1342 [Halalkalibacter akibai JCM 9157]